VLSRRLVTLVDAGILTTSVYQDRPLRREYLLTEAGKDLWQVFIALWAWDRQWVPSPPGLAGVELRHLPCNNLVMPVMGCQACGAIGVTARDVTAVADPWTFGALTTRGRRSSVASEVLTSTSVLGDRWSILVLAQA